jgi:hypothetical protein
VATALLAGVYWAVVGRVFVGSDTLFALTWGRSIAHFRLPDYRIGPTAHPLTNLVGALLALLGKDGSYHAAQVLGALYLAAAVVVLFALARELAGTAVAVLAALLFGSSFGLMSPAMDAFYDSPALALLLGAALSAVREPRPGLRTGVLLALAGLIRPEYWLYCVLYSAYALLRGDGRRRFLVAAVPLAAPVIWSLTDWIITGHPRFSLSHTQELTQVLGRKTGLGHVPRAVLDGLHLQRAGAVPVLGLMGMALAAASRNRARFIPLAVIALGVLLTYALTGLENLSLIDRYLLPAAAVLSIFAAYAALGWVGDDETRLPRAALAGVSAVALVVLLLSIPNRVDGLQDARARARVRNSMQSDLRTLLERLPPCRPIHTYRGFVIVDPAFRFEFGDWGDPRLELSQSPPRGVFIGPRTRSDAVQVRLQAGDRVSVPRLPGHVVQTSHWSWSTVRCPAAVDSPRAQPAP